MLVHQGYVGMVMGLSGVVVGVISIWELNAVDTKLLSAPAIGIHCSRWSIAISQLGYCRIVVLNCGTIPLECHRSPHQASGFLTCPSAPLLFVVLALAVLLQSRARWPTQLHLWHLGAHGPSW
ncbi:hypothetical protein Tco_0213537 [Tanacetum coccineum]